MNKAIEEIIRFQTDRGLHLKDYNSINEHTNIIEELLESVGMDVPKENRNNLAKEIEHFILWVNALGIVTIIDTPNGDNERVDAYADVIVFAIGAILKLGFDPIKVLLEVGKEINSREGTMVNGKFEKYLTDEAKAKWYTADYGVAKGIL